MPAGSAYDLSTASLLVLIRLGTRMEVFLVSLLAILAASPRPVAQSYTEALDTSMPSSSHIRLWYSNMDWSIPWVISGW